MSDCTGPHTSVFDCPEHSPTRPAPERTEGEGDDRCDRCAGKPDAECRVLCFQCWTDYVPHVEERRVRAAPERAESERRDVFGRAIDMSVEALRQRNEKAHEMVTALCKPRGTEGSREWIMSIPARPDDDPDLVIGQALNDAKRL